MAKLTALVVFGILCVLAVPCFCKPSTGQAEDCKDDKVKGDGKSAAKYAVKTKQQNNAGEAKTGSAAAFSESESTATVTDTQIKDKDGKTRTVKGAQNTNKIAEGSKQSSQDTKYAQSDKQTLETSDDDNETRTTLTKDQQKAIDTEKQERLEKRQKEESNSVTVEEVNPDDIKAGAAAGRKVTQSGNVKVSKDVKNTESEKITNSTSVEETTDNVGDTIIITHETEDINKQVQEKVVENKDIESDYYVEELEVVTEPDDIYSYEIFDDPVDNKTAPTPTSPKKV